MKTPTLKRQEPDIPALKEVLEQTSLFPSELLPEMVTSFLSQKSDSQTWLSAEVAGAAVGFCYATQEQFTVGTWNMLAIAVHPGHQRTGLGDALVRALENELRKRQQRIMIIDTAGSPEYEGTRQFYDENGYTREARIRDFWGDGVDKVVFWKALTT